MLHRRMATRQVMEAVAVVVAVAASWYIGLHLYQQVSVSRYGHGPRTGDLATLGLWSAFVTATFIPFAYARAADYVAHRPFTIVTRLFAGAALGIVLSALPLILSILIMGDGIPPTMPLRFVLPFFAWLAVMGAVVTAALAAIRERE